MPEGDSIHNIAATMRPLVVGKLLVLVRAGGVEHTALAGQTVTAVEAVGKHLLVTTDTGVVIRSHLGMNGRWSRHPAAAPPPSARSASLVLATADDILICTRAKQVEILGGRDPRLGIAVGRLGPDVLGASFDVAAVITRARKLPFETEIAEVLLDQKVACGIGDIYKCEALFLTGWHPRAPLAALDDDALTSVYQHARMLMQQNVGAGRRTTREPGAAHPYWVYGRTGQPCARCESRIESDLQGGEQRRSYWCRRCQAAGA